MLADHSIDVMLTAPDLGAVKRFYGDTVGLEVLIDNDDFVTFLCGGDSRLVVTRTSTPSTEETTRASWRVDDVAAEVGELRARGVTRRGRSSARRSAAGRWRTRPSRAMSPWAGSLGLRRCAAPDGWRARRTHGTPLARVPLLPAPGSDRFGALDHQRSGMPGPGRPATSLGVGSAPQVWQRRCRSTSPPQSVCS